MPTPGVHFDHVWKKFRRGERHDSLRDLVPSFIRGRFKSIDPAELSNTEFWALRDVSFRVGPGEALGIIGANGAGKSTTLKLLTKILRPTQGVAMVQGRPGALIEVAAGFHPDLTGRENVYLQGAVMGLTRRDVAARFDEIVAFSGVEAFLDTQVKRYSSGMNARLGFAIAAHLNPDVLIIDEVLAVGDFAFQQRAFARLETIANEGVPLVVVSHQLDRIASLCTGALVLARGEVVKQGLPRDCIDFYLNSSERSGTAQDSNITIAIDAHDSSSVRSGDIVRVVYTGQVVAAMPDTSGLSFRLRSVKTGSVLFASSSMRCGITLPTKGAYRLTLDLQMNVAEGLYALETYVYDRLAQCELMTGPTLSIHVQEGPSFEGLVQLNASAALD